MLQKSLLKQRRNQDESISCHTFSNLRTLLNKQNQQRPKAGRTSLRSAAV